MHYVIRTSVIISVSRCMFVCMCVRLSACMYVCMYVYLYVFARLLWVVFESEDMVGLST